MPFNNPDSWINGPSERTDGLEQKYDECVLCGEKIDLGMAKLNQYGECEHCEAEVEDE